MKIWIQHPFRGYSQKKKGNDHLKFNEEKRKIINLRGESHERRFEWLNVSLKVLFSRFSWKPI